MMIRERQARSEIYFAKKRRCSVVLLAFMLFFIVVALKYFVKHDHSDRQFYFSLSFRQFHHWSASSHQVAGRMTHLTAVHHGGKKREVLTAQSPLLTENARAAQFLQRRTSIRNSESYDANKQSNIAIEYATSEDDFVVQTDVLPDERYRPEVGSGEVATVVFTDTLYRAGLFSGAFGESHRARIPAFISFRLIAVDKSESEAARGEHESEKPIGSRSNVYQLNMAEGYFLRLLQLQVGEYSYIVAQRNYVHRVIPSVWVVEVEVYRRPSITMHAGTESDAQSRRDLQLNTDPTAAPNTLHLDLIKLCLNETSDDVQFEELESPFSNTRLLFGQTRIPEVDGASTQNVTVLFDVLPNTLELPPSTGHAKWTFLMSVADDPLDCTSAYEQAAKLALSDGLFGPHTAAWVTLWNNGSLKLSTNRTDEYKLDSYRFPVPISSSDSREESPSSTTDAELEQSQQPTALVTNTTRLTVSVIAGQYYLLSSLKTSTEGAAYGLSPGGLAHGALNPHDYLGHSFWDQETWMYPPLLLMHPQHAKRLLEYRVARLESAFRNAIHWGNQGAQFPWESAHTGLEVCPGDRWARYQIHISGDISLAIVQYLYLTNDTNWFYTPVPTAAGSAIASDGADDWQSDTAEALDGHTPYEAVLQIARFWSKRVQLNQVTGLYEVHGVMPPDEWHWNVSNSVYTNVIAGVALRAPYDLWTFTQPKQTVPDELLALKNIGDRMFVLYDDQLKFHPEFDGYVKGEVVLQADITMLSYPLLYNGSDMNLESMRNDLVFYEPVVSFQGPAMTWPMFSIGWLGLQRLTGADLNEILQNANRLLQKNFLYIQPPFNIWTEGYLGLGCVNFITGYGGYLQNYLNGFLGIRIRRDRLDFDPLLPDSITEITLTFNFRQCRLDLHVDSSNIMLTLRECSSEKSLSLFSYADSQRVPLTLDVTVQRERAQFAIMEN